MSRRECDRTNPRCCARSQRLDSLLEVIHFAGHHSLHTHPAALLHSTRPPNSVKGRSKTRGQDTLLLSCSSARHCLGVDFSWHTLFRTAHHARVVRSAAVKRLCVRSHTDPIQRRAPIYRKNNADTKETRAHEVLNLHTRKHASELSWLSQSNLSLKQNVPVRTYEPPRNRRILLFIRVTSH